MKSKLLMFIATLVASVCSIEMQAQTDVTSTYIPNANFDSDYNYTASSTGNLATGGSGKKAVTGWTVTSGTNSCAGTFEYGTSATFNGATIPASGHNESAGGCMVFSNGWGESLIYTSSEVTLPAGKYTFVYVVQNRIGAGIGSSRFGFVPTSGTAVYGTKTAFAQDTWETDSISFTLPDDASGKFSMGFIAIAGTGSGGSAKLCVDYVKLLSYGADKESLNRKISEAQTLVGTDAGEDAQALRAVISSAQNVIDDPNATQADVNLAVSGLESAMFTYKIAVASSDNPQDLTSKIVNPGFNADLNGWTIVNISRQTNNSFTLKEGAAYAERWSGSKFTNDTRIEQTISNLPNGKYKLVVAAGFNYTGAYLYANNGRTVINGDDINTDYEVQCNVTDGTLKMGLEALAAELSGSGACYFRFDNFRLQYLGIDLSEFEADLSSLIEKAESPTYSGSDVVFYNTLRTNLTTAISEAKTTLSGAHTLENLIEAINNLQSNLDLADASILAYNTFKAVIDEANAYLSTVTSPSQEAKNTFEAAITAASTLYEGASKESWDTEIQELKAAQQTYMFAQPVPADITAMIVNPSFADGDTGWGKTQNSTGGYTENFTEAGSDESPCYSYGFYGRMRHATIYQENISLPAGVYTVTADVYGDPIPDKTYLYATTGAVDHWAAEPFAGYYVTSPLTQSNAWQTLSVTFVLSAESNVRVGVLSWSGNVDSEKRGAFKADNFNLFYHQDCAIESADNTLKVTGTLSSAHQTNLNKALTAGITSVDMTNASASETLELAPTNPHTIFYGLPAGVTLTQGIDAASRPSLTLSDAHAFHAPTGFEVEGVTYTRAFNSNGAISNETTVSGWQSIVLPFAVTEITATQNESPIQLVPFAAWDETAKADGKRPFWLYKVNPEATNALDAYIPASSMEANTTYLISMPNDPSYGTAYNITGTVQFAGTAVESTNLSAQPVQAGYTLNPNFEGHKAGVYALNEAGSAWIANQTAPSFHGYASTTDGSTPQSLPIFGDNDLTSLKEILSGVANDTNAVLITTDNGVILDSAKASKVAVYTVNGQLVKVVSISEGSNFISLPAGQYVISGSVVIVK